LPRQRHGSRPWNTPAAALLAELRRHQARQVDLIYDAWDQDIGIGN
jgi:hypothetical protein